MNTPKITRRQFLTIAGAAVTTVAVAYKVPSFFGFKKSGYIAGGDLMRNFILIDMASRETISVPTPILAHSFKLWPHLKRHVIGVEKAGNKIALVDFDSRKVVHVTEAPADRLFYGHTCFTPDMTYMLASQVDTVTGLGYLVAYTPELQRVNEWQVTPGVIHDIAFLPDDRNTLAFTSAGVISKYRPGSDVHAEAKRVEKSALMLFDWSKKTVIEKHILEDESRAVGHVLPLHGNRVAVALTIFDEYKGPQKATYGQVGLVTKGVDGIRMFEIPPEVAGSLDYEFLSLATDQKEKILVATNPCGHQTLVFSLETGRTIEDLPIHTNGVAINDQTIIVFPLDGFSNYKSKIIPKTELLPPRLVTSSHILFFEDWV